MSFIPIVVARVPAFVLVPSSDSHRVGHEGSQVMLTYPVGCVTDKEPGVRGARFFYNG